MPRVAQAGAIAVDLTGPRPRFLLVSARKNPEHWILPKGHIEPGEAPEAAALRELGEEAGVRGDLIAQVGTSRFRSGAEDVEVAYYLVRATGEVRPQELRRRLWLEYEPARRHLSFDSARDLLDRAVALLPAARPL